MQKMVVPMLAQVEVSGPRDLYAQVEAMEKAVKAQCRGRLQQDEYVEPRTVQEFGDAPSVTDLVTPAPNGQALRALQKAEAVLAQLQDRPEQAREIIAQGYYAVALVEVRRALAGR